MSNDQDLLSYNKHGALANCLAIEDHLASLPPGVNNSWCAKKHAMLCCNHHLAEAVNHASRISPELGAKYRALKNEAIRVLRPGMNDPLPRLGDVAAFRNSMRHVFEDPTLTESCELCKKDGGLSGLPAVTMSPNLMLAGSLAGVAWGLGKPCKWSLLLGLVAFWKANQLRKEAEEAF